MVWQFAGSADVANVRCTTSLCRRLLPSIKEKPRPTIFVFLPPSDPLMNHLDPRRRAEPELPHVGRSAVAATDVASCFALGTLVLLEDGSHAEVKNLAGSMVRTTDGGSA